MKAIRTEHLLNALLVDNGVFREMTFNLADFETLRQDVLTVTVPNQENAKDTVWTTVNPNPNINLSEEERKDFLCFELLKHAMKERLSVPTSFFRQSLRSRLTKVRQN